MDTLTPRLLVFPAQRKQSNKVAKAAPVAIKTTTTALYLPHKTSDDSLSHSEPVAIMRINCFRASHGTTDQEYEPPARTPNKRNVRRSASGQSAQSRCSIASNASILKLAPCKGVGDPRVEAAMMAVPPEPRPSKCMRLSRPKHYSDIISAMKESQNSRDWKNFPVFHDDIDTKSADEYARAVRARTIEYERTGRRPNLFGSNEDSILLGGIDMIG